MKADLASCKIERTPFYDMTTTTFLFFHRFIIFDLPHRRPATAKPFSAFRAEKVSSVSQYVW